MNPQDSSHLPQAPAERHAPIPGWLTGLGLVLAFWAGGYLFLYSGGFRGDVYDPGQITWGPVSTGPVSPPVRSAIASSNSATPSHSVPVSRAVRAMGSRPCP